MNLSKSHSPWEKMIKVTTMKHPRVSCDVEQMKKFMQQIRKQNFLTLKFGRAIWESFYVDFNRKLFQDSFFAIFKGNSLRTFSDTRLNKRKAPFGSFTRGTINRHFWQKELFVLNQLYQHISFSLKLASFRPN